ncbi:MAG: Hemerythrin cation binding protein [Chloroflexi bacterium]|jgi:deazaflavin-dependent oxidoreductase (nitroreductase family)|nr:Hemerythrin cation binding protein [Chloroflexota bacterium]
MADPNVDFNTGVIAEFRANGGKAGGPFTGAPLVLLTTTGAKSGKQLTTPLMYNTDGDRVLVFASKGGAPTNPAWYHNLTAHPKVTVEIGNDSYEANAVVLTGAERDRLYSRQAEQFPQFAEYQANTSRTIPVVALERVK